MVEQYQESFYLFARVSGSQCTRGCSAQATDKYQPVYVPDHQEVQTDFGLPIELTASFVQSGSTSITNCPEGKLLNIHPYGLPDAYCTAYRLRIADDPPPPSPPSPPPPPFPPSPSQPDICFGRTVVEWADLQWNLLSPYYLPRTPTYTDNRSSAADMGVAGCNENAHVEMCPISSDVLNSNNVQNCYWLDRQSIEKGTIRGHPAGQRRECEDFLVEIRQDDGTYKYYPCMYNCPKADILAGTCGGPEQHDQQR